MRLPGSAGFDYGNTRLRARRGAFLDESDYERLINSDLAGLVDAVAATQYAPDIAAAEHRYTGVQQLHEAIRTHLGRSLEEMRSFYSGQSRVLVDLLLSHFDTQNIVAVLRATSHPDASTDDARAALVPMGWLVEPLTTKVLRLHELAAVIDLLIRSTPNGDQARTLRSAFREYERTEDLAALERTVVANHAARVATTLAGAGPDGAMLLRFARREVDERNLLVALRLRDALASGAHGAAAPGDPLLPGGSIPRAAFTRAAHEPVPAAIVDALGRGAGGRWQRSLQRWAATGDLYELHRALERRVSSDAVALFRTGDPLAVDVPLAFSAAAQRQARNLRLLGEAAARAIPAELIRRELLWARERT